ncbi:MAG: choice-of-anchor D domain-containing protein [Pseudonocardiaceae bacterium]
MRARLLGSRLGRAVLLGTVAAVVAAVLVLVGAGPQQRADAAVSPGTTQLVSTDKDAPFAASGQAAVSANGRYVAFTTLKSLDPLDVHREGDSDLDVYVRDLWEQKTVLISHGALLPLKNITRTDSVPDVLTVPADGHSGNPSISADGRYVAFQTTANNLGAQDHDFKSDVVVVDRDPTGSGVFDQKNCPLLLVYCHQVTRVSADLFDDQGRPMAGAGAPSIDAAGDAVAWVGVTLPNQESFSDGNGHYRGVPVVYRSTLDKGPAGNLTAVRSQQVNARADGLVVRGETAPALSSDGRRLALVAQTQPVNGTENSTTADAHAAVLGVDFPAGPLADTNGEGFAATRLDVDENGNPLSLPSGFNAAPTVSGDGRLVAFTAPGAGSQVVRTAAWETGQRPRSDVVSTDITGKPVNGRDPALSANGRYLAFTTSARNTHNGVDGPETTCGSAADQAPPGTGPPGAGRPGIGIGLGVGLSLDVDLDVDIDPLLYLDADVDVDVGLGLGLGIGHRAPAPPQQTQPPDPAAVSHCDVVVRDLVLDQARAAANLPKLPAELASPSLARDCVPNLAPDATCEGDDASGYPSLSADGGVVAYESKAATLVPEDPNGHIQDVFARTFAPRLTADPLDFFTVAPGSSTVGSTSLRHVGFGPLLVESMTISGPNAADFTVTAETCVGRTVQAGESCLVSVRFAPSGLGPRHGALEVRYRGTGSPLIVPLTGIASRQPPRAVVFTPEPLSFGENLPLSTSPPGDVTVRNNGSAPMTISAVGLPTDAGPAKHPEDYKITKDGCTGRTLRPGESCAVTLQHSPQGVGDRPAVVRFDDNAPNAPQLVAVQGSGLQPRLQFNPAVAPASRVSTLFGSDFPPQHSVTIQMPDVPGLITVTTDPAGNFSTPIVIFPNATPGERTAVATVAGHQPPITATATLLVVPGTVGPPGFADRR